MNTGTGRSVRAILCVIGFVLLLTLLLPTPAFADTVGGVTQSADDTVGGVTQSADDTVGGVTQSADDTVGGVTQSASDTVGGVTDVVNGGTSLKTQVGGSTSERDGSNEGAASNPASDRAPEGSSGWLAYDRRMASASTTFGQSQLTIYRENDDGEDGEVDPCTTNPQLVCLGVLFGLGEFADTGTKVLGALVRTGFTALGLLVLALAVGGMGAAALAASSDRFALIARRAG
jgi:hypothetical protein